MRVNICALLVALCTLCFCLNDLLAQTAPTESQQVQETAFYLTTFPKHRNLELLHLNPLKLLKLLLQKMNMVLCGLVEGKVSFDMTGRSIFILNMTQMIQRHFLHNGWKKLIY